MAGLTLNARETAILAIIIEDNEVRCDLQKVIARCGFNTKSAASMAWWTLRKKLAASSAADTTTNGDSNKRTAKPKASAKGAKAGGKKTGRKTKNGNAGGDDEINGQVFGGELASKKRGRSASTGVDDTKNKRVKKAYEASDDDEEAEDDGMAEIKSENAVEDAEILGE